MDAAAAWGWSPGRDLLANEAQLVGELLADVSWAVGGLTGLFACLQAMQAQGVHMHKRKRLLGHGPADGCCGGRVLQPGLPCIIKQTEPLCCSLALVLAQVQGQNKGACVVGVPRNNLHDPLDPAESCHGQQHQKQPDHRCCVGRRHLPAVLPAAALQHSIPLQAGQPQRQSQATTTSQLWLPLHMVRRIGTRAVGGHVWFGLSSKGLHTLAVTLPLLSYLSCVSWIRCLGCRGWLPRTIKTSDLELLQSCGLDALVGQYLTESYTCQLLACLHMLHDPCSLLNWSAHDHHINFLACFFPADDGESQRRRIAALPATACRGSRCP